MEALIIAVLLVLLLLDVLALVLATAIPKLVKLALVGSAIPVLQVLTLPDFLAMVLEIQTVRLVPHVEMVVSLMRAQLALSRTATVVLEPVPLRTRKPVKYAKMVGPRTLAPLVHIVREKAAPEQDLRIRRLVHLVPMVARIESILVRLVVLRLVLLVLEPVVRIPKLVLVVTTEVLITSAPMAVFLQEPLVMVRAAAIPRPASNPPLVPIMDVVTTPPSFVTIPLLSVSENVAALPSLR